LFTSKQVGKRLDLDEVMLDPFPARVGIINIIFSFILFVRNIKVEILEI